MLSATEGAFLSITRSHLKDQDGVETSTNGLTNLLEDPPRVFATLSFANNMVNIAIVILWAVFLQGYLGIGLHSPVWFVLHLVGVVAVVLICCEILPKRYASRHGLSFSIFMAKPVSFLIRLFQPLLALLEQKPNLAEARYLKTTNHNVAGDLSVVLAQGKTKPANEQETSILKGIVRFGNIFTRQVMRSRMDVVAVEIDTPIHKLLKIVVEAGYSRIPVFRESFDDIVGILYIKDLLPHIGIADESFQWSKLIRPCVFVPESKKISNLLKEFQEKKIHMAVVVDEYGGVSGIVTLEDILEEIVGEINDEFDTEESFYAKIDAHTYLFEGKTQLKDFCRITGCSLGLFDALQGDADTLAGLILEQSQELPAIGDEFLFQGFTLQVEEVDSRRIQKIKVSFLPVAQK